MAWIPFGWHVQFAVAAQAATAVVLPHLSKQLAKSGGACHVRDMILAAESKYLDAKKETKPFTHVCAAFKDWSEKIGVKNP